MFVEISRLTSILFGKTRKNYYHSYTAATGTQIDVIKLTFLAIKPLIIVLLLWLV